MKRNGPGKENGLVVPATRIYRVRLAAIRTVRTVDAGFSGKAPLAGTQIEGKYSRCTQRTHAKSHSTRVGALTKPLAEQHGGIG